jgi:uncharacterized protein (DUF433 family)
MPRKKALINSATRKRQLLQSIKRSQYVVIDPKINRGKLTFKGTRILVETVLTALEKDGKMEPILARYPKLSREAIREAVELASQALVRPFEPGHDRKLRLPA